MGRFIGGRFGTINSVVENGAPTSGIYSIFDQYYIRRDNNGWIDPPLGSVQSNPATSAQAIIDAGASTGNGYYWIQTTSGMANPVRVWCDMTTQTNIGWMRFWWYGRYEQTGSSPSGQFVTQDQLGIADISTIAYDAVHGRGRIPAGQTINGIMVKGNSTPNPIQNGNLPYAIWNTGSGTTAETRVLNAFQSGTTSTGSGLGEWQPASWNHLSDTQALSTSGTCSAFYYQDQGSQGYNSFHFDDDTGYCVTAFSAGYDGGATGIDVFDNGVNCDTNSSSRNLVIYWR